MDIREKSGTNKSKFGTIKKPNTILDWRCLLPLGLVSLPQLLRGEDQVDYRYENYQEDDHRMAIETHSVYFEQKLIDAIIAKGELVYDGISGSSPKGTVVNGKAALTEVKDVRHAINLSLDCQALGQTLSPGLAYSKESDYQSYGMSLNDAIPFNEKNTILQFGASQNIDSVRHADRINWSDKNDSEVIVGVSQLLTPKTVLEAAFTMGFETGYLNDPYRLAAYQPSYLPFSIGIGEVRPDYRTKEVFYTSLTQYFETINGSLEGSYRFHHDSYDIFSQTFELDWHQWVGKHLILEPFVRFYYQTAASFYSPLFADPLPQYYSSDYRLSEFYSTDIGIEATVVINDYCRVVAGYHRYEMHGLDNTISDMYPKANVITAGLSILW